MEGKQGLQGPAQCAPCVCVCPVLWWPWQRRLRIALDPHRPWARGSCGDTFTVFLHVRVFSPLELKDFCGTKIFCAILIKPFIFVAWYPGCSEASNVETDCADSDAGVGPLPQWRRPPAPSTSPFPRPVVFVLRPAPCVLMLCPASAVCLWSGVSSALSGCQLGEGC